MEIKLIDAVPQDYTKHIPLVLQHWERPFRGVENLLRKEAKAAGFRYPLVVDYSVFAFEYYHVVLEYDSFGIPLRMFFPDEQTELLLLMKAQFC